MLDQPQVMVLWRRGSRTRRRLGRSQFPSRGVAGGAGAPFPLPDALFIALETTAVVRPQPCELTPGLFRAKPFTYERSVSRSMPICRWDMRAVRLKRDDLGTPYENHHCFTSIHRGCFCTRDCRCPKSGLQGWGIFLLWNRGDRNGRVQIDPHVYW